MAPQSSQQEGKEKNWKMHMVLRSHGKRRETSIPILPEEIISDILIRLQEWKILNFTHLKKMDARLLSSKPVTSIGFIYWASHYHPYILALDVELESIKPISLPCDCSGPNKFLLKGNSISLLHVKSDFSIEVWLLKDHRTEEWVKFLCMEGEPLRNEFENILLHYDMRLRADQSIWLDPISWLGNGERIVFHTLLNEGNLFVYDLKTHSCSQVAIGNGYYNHISFVNSLAWV